MKKNILLTLALATVIALSSEAKNWMSKLPDSALICMLSIPGTHDSGTGNGFEPDVAAIGEHADVGAAHGVGDTGAEGLHAVHVHDDNLVLAH